jgi:putative flippase GtrA
VSRGRIQALLDAPLVKFLVAGLLTVVVDYGTFSAAFVVLHLDLRVATVASYTSGVVVSFLLNKIWVFDSRGNSGTQDMRQLLLYGLLLGLNILFTYCFIVGMEDLWGIDPRLSKLISIGIVAASNYVLYRRVVFAERSVTCGASTRAR